LNGEAIRIVGVMPEEYKFPVNSDLWVPLSSRDISPADYSQSAVEAYARLQPGTSAAAATTQLNGLLENIQRQRPEARNESLVVGNVSTFQKAQWGEWGPRIFVVLNALAFFVLVLACVNVGNLLLVRTNERIKEIAVRIALGAGRSRLIAQMSLQNIIICVTGGSLAFFVVARGLAVTDNFLSSLIGSETPYWWNWNLDSGTALAGGMFLLITIAMVSVLPIHAAFKVSPNVILKESIQGATARSIGRISRILVTAQVALVSAVMLSGGTAAFISYRLASFDSGIDPRDLYITQYVWAGAEHDSDEHLEVFERLVSELQNDAQVSSLAISQSLGDNAFAVEGVAYNTTADYPRASVSATVDTSQPDPTALLEGRGFDSQDNAGALRTAIVSESCPAHAPGRRRQTGRDDEVGGTV
jgi:hypothetical protein